MINEETFLSEQSIRRQKSQADRWWATSFVTTLAQVPMAGVMIALYANWVPRTALLLWAALLVGLALARSILFRIYSGQRQTAQTLRFWIRYAVAHAAVAGLLWGGAGLWLAPKATSQEGSVLFFVALSLALGGLVNVSIWPAHAAFLLPNLLLTAAGFLWSGRPEGFVFAVLLGLALVFFIALGRMLSSRPLGKGDELLSLLFEANAALRELATIDPLTNLLNRRGFERVFKAEWAKAARTRRPLSLLSIDIDRFKTINDTQGHTVGDRCLVDVGLLIASCIRRDVDHIARFGGEELLVLLPETPLQAAEGVAERIRATIAEDNIQHQRLTVSIGVASTHPSGEPFWTRLLTAADAALYDAKRSGRNCVVACIEEVSAAASSTDEAA